MSRSSFRFSFFVARRLIHDRSAGRHSVERLIGFTVAGVALCLAVVQLTLLVSQGFNRAVKQRVALATGDLVLSPYEGTVPTLQASEDMLRMLSETSGIKHIRPVLQTTGILKSDSAFAAVTILGISSAQELRETDELLASGSIPPFDTLGMRNNEALLSLDAARKLDKKPGDKVLFYLYEADNIVMKQLKVAGIVNLPLSAGETAIVPLPYLQKTLGVNENTISRIELFTKRNADKDSVLSDVVSRLSNSPYIGEQRLGISTSEDLMPSVYRWIDMLDGNVALLITIMAIVAAFTMATGLIILILGRTRTTGVMKAIGASNASVGGIYLILALRVIVRGIIWGNLITAGLALAQYYGHFLRLNADIYYVSYVPLAFAWDSWLLANIGALLLVLILLFLPAAVVARIKPAEILRFQ